MLFAFAKSLFYEVLTWPVIARGNIDKGWQIIPITPLIVFRPWPTPWGASCAYRFTPSQKNIVFEIQEITLRMVKHLRIQVTIAALQAQDT